MDIGQRFSFDEAGFHAEVAHGGNGRILTSRVFQGRDVSHCRFVDLSRVPPGSEVGVHTHERDNHELYVIVAGRGLMHIDGQEVEVGPGDVVMNRPGGTHGLKNLSETEIRLVVIEVEAKMRAPADRGAPERG